MYIVNQINLVITTFCIQHFVYTRIGLKLKMHIS